MRLCGPRSGMRQSRGQRAAMRRCARSNSSGVTMAGQAPSTRASGAPSAGLAGKTHVPVYASFASNARTARLVHRPPLQVGVPSLFSVVAMSAVLRRAAAMSKMCLTHLTRRRVDDQHHALPCAVLDARLLVAVRRARPHPEATRSGFPQAASHILAQHPAEQRIHVRSSGAAAIVGRCGNAPASRAGASRRWRRGAAIFIRAILTEPAPPRRRIG